MLIETMLVCEGAEVHQDDWPTVERLVKTGRAKWVSEVRGPDKAWRRAELV